MKKVSRSQIVKFCNEYLKIEKYHDSCASGIQVEGGDDVTKIITGVSINLPLIKQAIEKKAEMIMVHHGMFKECLGDMPVIDGVWRDRLALLLKHNISLVGYHLPVDAHPIIGNNISLANLFGLKNLRTIITPDYGEIGYIGDMKKPLGITDFVAAVNKKLGTNPSVIDAGKSTVRRLAIISGAASPEYAVVQKLGADTFLTGDIRENIVWEAQEAGINFVSAGHYNTEKLGIKNLGELVAKKFGIKVEFIDTPCEI